MNFEGAAKLNHSDWQQRAAELKKTATTGLFIGGEFVDAIEGGTFENICPVDGSVINICAAGTQADIDKAVAIAKASLKSGEWSRMAPRNRMAVMYKWAQLIEENGAELALLDTIDMGKDAYTCGDPLDPSVNLGPLIDHQSQGRVLSMIETALAEGGTIEFGGEAAGGDLHKGAYVIPTIITGASENDTIAQHEAFGPVVAVIKVDSDDEAIRVANNSIYGLQGSVWTDNYRRAMRFVREIECGTFLVNSFEEGDMTQPFGGYKQSGNAKDKCFESLLSYTNTKAAWFSLN